MSRVDDVVHDITQMIASGELRPGNRLPVESELCAKFNVSRGPLREGVRALMARGVLFSRQGDGTYVTSLEPEKLFGALAFAADLHSISEPLDTLAVRRVLETESAGLAAQFMSVEALDEAVRLLDRSDEVLSNSPQDHKTLMEIDRAFHEIIAQASGNRVLVALISALGGETTRVRTWRHLVEDEASWRSLGEHRSILAAIAARDVGRARSLMAYHILGVEDFTRLTAVDTDQVPPNRDSAERPSS